MKQFISPRTAQSEARAQCRPGFTFEVVPKRTFNRDRSVDISFGVRFFDRDGQPSGVLR